MPEVFAASCATYYPSFALFPASDGSHQVCVVYLDSGEAPACAQLTAKQGTRSVDVAAGQQSLVFVYRTSVTDLHLAVGPIQP